MLKKALSVVGLAAVLILGGAAASASAYPIAPDCVEVSDSTIAAGETVTVTVSCIEGETSATFAAEGGPATLASIVLASAGTASVTKPVVDGSTSAQFTPHADGEYTITVTGGSGAFLASVVISVDDAFANGGTGAGTGGGGDTGGLPATGAGVPAAAIWFGAGAVGLGALAVVAGFARKRAASAH